MRYRHKSAHSLAVCGYTCDFAHKDPDSPMPAPIINRADTLIFARWIIPVAANSAPLANYAIAINDGKIAAILPAAEAEAITASETLHLNHHALMPGLINAHGHAAMSLFRGMADDKALDTWLNDHIWPAEGQWVNEDFVRDGSELAIAEMLRSGTTTFSDMYFFPEITAQVARKAGIRAQLSFPIFDFPCAWGSGPDDYFRKGLALLDDHKYSELINIAFGPHAPYTVGDEAMQRIVTFAAELDVPIQIHLHETQQEVDDAVAQLGQRPIARLAALGLLGPKTQFVHLTALNDEDIATLASHGCHAVHCPESNLKLASGFSPIEKMRKAGINVALGTDGAASNNDLDLFGEMRTAAMLGKAVANDASALPDSYALEMATLNGAKALGIDHLVGSLEVGKQADIIAIDLSGLEQQPIYKPTSQIVYTNISHQVRYSWIMGRKVLDNGELTTLDSRDIIARAELWRKKISGE
tara:strand:- start:526 stop:1938 length:1413 start_codon:yes stop_codon:yes gene_type:complete